jgi:DNA repair protein RadC
MVMNIKDLPADQRPRERLCRLGAHVLSDAELLAVLLRTGRRGQHVMALAGDLLRQLGGLAGLTRSSMQELGRIAGIGPTKSSQLHAAIELARRALMAPLDREQALRDPGACKPFVHAWLRPQKREVVGALYLDVRNRLISARVIALGGVAGAVVHLGELVREALDLQAASVILAHNHPAGSTDPSDEDLALTQRARAALALVDIRLLDHLIVHEGEPTSLAERGLL